MLVPYTKEGKSIQGTLETLNGVALVVGKDEAGELVYSGQTDIWYDEQKTVEINQQRVFIDEDGNEVMESELVWKEEADA